MFSENVNQVSVIVTCHNEEKFIKECLVSIINQSYCEIIKEIIVIIDSSEDSSVEIVKSLKQKNSKLKMIEVNYGSLSKSRNHGIRLTSSKYIAFLDGDDYWSKNKLYNQFIIFEKLDNSYAFLYTNFIDFNNDKQKNNYKNISVKSYNKKDSDQLIDYFCKDGPIVPSTIMVKSNIFKYIGSFDENLKYYEDTDFYLRVLEKYKIYHLNEFSCFKRKHQGQITNQLYKLIPYGDLVIKNAIKRNKNLIKYKNIRYSRNRNKAATHALYYLDKKKIAQKLILDSLNINPFNFYSWILFFLTLFPRFIRLFIIRLIKNLKNVNTS